MKQKYQNSNGTLSHAVTIP